MFNPILLVLTLAAVNGVSVLIVGAVLSIFITFPVAMAPTFPVCPAVWLSVNLAIIVPFFSNVIFPV